MILKHLLGPFVKINRTYTIQGTRYLIFCLGPTLFVLLAVFLSAVPLAGQAELAGVIWEEKIEVASGGGYEEPWRMNESVYDYVDDPTVAINAQGGVGVAWADQSRKDIFFQLVTPDGKERFEEPVNVSGTPQIFSWLPRMVVTSTDAIKVFLLWQEIVFSGGSHGGEIFFARSTDGGKTLATSDLGPIYLQLRIFHRRCPLFGGFRPLHPQEQTFLVVSPKVRS